MSYRYMLRVISITAFLLITLVANAQKPDVIVLEQVIVGDDTLPMIRLEPIDITATQITDVKEISSKLKRHIRVAYPYAIRTARIVNQVEEELAKLDRPRERRKYIRQTEKVMKAEFKADLKDLTRTQGKMLVKLIYRETGSTVHSLIAQYQSNFTAGWWQMIGKAWDLNLKDEYHPEEKDEDAAMEKYVAYLDNLYQRSGLKTKLENEEINTSVQIKERKRTRSKSK